MIAPWALRIGSIVLGTSLAIAADGLTQVPPASMPESGRADPTQLQRDKELMELNPVEKPKPEVEVLTPLDPATTSPKDIVIVPDEPDKPPSRAVKDKDESPKKKDDY